MSPSCTALSHLMRAMILQCPEMVRIIWNLGSCTARSHWVLGRAGLKYSYVPYPYEGIVTGGQSQGQRRVPTYRTPM